MMTSASNHDAFRLGVTFHSFTDEYCSAKWSLDDLMELTTRLGGGVEIVGPAHQRGFPYLSLDFERSFKSAVERYALTPTAYGSYADPFMRPDRNLTEDELVAYTLPQLDAAARLGFPIVRLQFFAAPVVERLLPLAERLGLKLGYELHAPLTFESDHTQRLIEQIRRLDTPLLGIIPDCGIFGRSIPKFRRLQALERGMSPQTLEKALNLWQANIDLHDALVQLKSDNLTAHQEESVETFWGSIGQSDPAHLKSNIDIIIHMHGKYFSIVDGDEPDLVYEGVVKNLVEANYDGWMSTEYEGPGDVNSFFIVKAHQEMVSRYMDKYAAGAAVLAPSA